MKYLIFLLSIMIMANDPIVEQSKLSLEGAWTFVDGNVKTVRIMSGKYFAEGSYTVDSSKFVSAKGGTFEFDGKVIKETYEFNTIDPALVGVTVNLPLMELRGNISVDYGKQRLVWKRLDTGEPGALRGAWLFTGRKDGDEIKPFTPGVRKTMKIMSGSRFQWIAYNTQTKEFFGTGGGTYATVNGKYIENIDFFSRDNSRVGASLNFDFEVDGYVWHHSGLSSKGDPIYELWTRREQISGQ